MLKVEFCTKSLHAFAWCVGDGAASYLSICAGRKDSDSAHKCVGTGITASFIPDKAVLRSVLALGAVTFVTRISIVVQRAVIAQEEVIRAIADNGSCVIVGRAADYVLRDYDNVIRVFVHAPKEYRVSKVMEMYGDSREEARRNVRHSDIARAGYYRNISGQNWGMPHNYHLCLDASVGEETCADMICRQTKDKIQHFWHCFDISIENIFIFAILHMCVLEVYNYA